MEAIGILEREANRTAKTLSVDEVNKLVGMGDAKRIGDDFVRVNGNYYLEVESFADPTLRYYELLGEQGFWARQ